VLCPRIKINPRRTLMLAKDMALLTIAECDCNEETDERVEFLTAEEYNRGEFPRCSKCGKQYVIDLEYPVLDTINK
jgi:hypothetical protein